MRSIIIITDVTIRCTAPTTPENNSKECNSVGYQECISRFQMLVGSASVDQDLLFSEFCKSVK